MKNIFHFGENVEGYDIPVLNEREVRAGAGILLLGSLTTFFYAFLLGDFYPTKVFVTMFLVDFLMRVLINPQYAPSLILGRLIVSNQDVEYVGAPQKRFARAIGLFLSLIMFFLLVVFNVVSPINLIICVLCIIFLFFESTFGICLGCLMYEYITKQPAQLCPGGTCKETTKKPIQYVYVSHLLLVIGFVLFAFLLPFFIHPSGVKALGGDGDCVVPDRAKAIGHEQLRLEHHGCTEEKTETKRSEESNSDVGAQASSLTSTSLPDSLGEEEKPYDPNDPCQNIPEGHPRDLRLQHNGCL